MKKKLDMPSWAVAGHQKPITRRELLASGSIAFAASFVVPNWISLLLGSTANAENGCQNSGVSALPAFITLNLGGGMAMAANYLPMGPDGNKIKSYSKLGLGNNQVPVEYEFSNQAPFAGNNGAGSLYSKFLVGLRNRASRAVLSKASFIAIPCASGDDTSMNKFDMSGLVLRAGMTGQYLQNISTGGNFGQQPALSVPPTPLQVNKFEDILSSVGYTAAIGSKLNGSQKSALAKLSKNLSVSQSRRLASITTKKNVDSLLECAGITNVGLTTQGSEILDFRKNSTVSSIWGVTASTLTNAREMIFGALAYNALQGASGPALMQIGGYDYHGQSRTATDAKDQEAGEAIGMILSSAEALQKKVFIWIVSDGSVSSADSESRGGGWTGDSGTRGVAYCVMYDPKAAPVLNGFQIGSFNDNQSADPGFLTGDSPELATAAGFANYLKFAGKFELFEKISGRLFTNDQLDTIVKVG